MENLWKENTPKQFWQTEPLIEDQVWQEAIEKTYSVLGLTQEFSTIDHLLSQTLGEEQFGKDRYNLSAIKRMYYELKPILPRFVINTLKKLSSNVGPDQTLLSWPVEDRYVYFQWQVIKNVLEILGQTSIDFKHFWPGGKSFAFVLTHDVEMATGQSYVRKIADLEESFGFRSSFNFVPERYPLDKDLMKELRERGFEIGVHGLKHDGKLFFSQNEFSKRAQKINTYLQEFGAVGFRSPLTHRNPQWMQALNLDYDLSFFDSDPYEPVPGGSMSIWPYTLGKFTELPYTLVQDSTLRYTLEANDPGIWLDKVNFLKNYYGMALLNSHPDYLKDEKLFQIYTEFLKTIKNNGGYWHALPKEVTSCWKKRASGESTEKGTILVENSRIQIL